MILNGKLINPGELNTRIILQDRVLEQDEGGFSQPGVAREIEVWCRWINSHGYEAIQAGAAGLSKIAKVLIRYQEIDETWKVFYRYQVWEIRSIDNIREKDEYMELTVVRMAGA